MGLFDKAKEMSQQAVKTVNDASSNPIGAVFGNASNVDASETTNEYGHLLAPGESVCVAYKLIRDMFIFTQTRLILVDKQGISSKKIEIKSFPYNKINAFSVETAGVLDLDAELKIWVSGFQGPIEKKFNRNVNIYEVQATLSNAIAGNLE